jgi:hypothetical protein
MVLAAPGLLLTPPFSIYIGASSSSRPAVVASGRG